MQAWRHDVHAPAVSEERSVLDLLISQMHGEIAQMRAEIARDEAELSWRETVRDIYDALHKLSWTREGHDLTAHLITLIEERHPAFFGAERGNAP
jgi:uncharacterized small protein (DUF1192 family)